MSAADAALLFALTDNQFTLANLSALYRVTTLAGRRNSRLPICSRWPVLSPGTAAAAWFHLCVASGNLDVPLASESCTTAKPEHGCVDLHPHAAHGTTSGASDDRSQSMTVTSAAGFPGRISIFRSVRKSSRSRALVVRATRSGPCSGAGGDDPVGGNWRGECRALTDGWATTTQMTEANVAAALAAVQQAVRESSDHPDSGYNRRQTTISVASSAQFPPPNFYVSIGSEVLLVAAPVERTTPRGRWPAPNSEPPRGRRKRCSVMPTRPYDPRRRSVQQRRR